MERRGSMVEYVRPDGFRPQALKEAIELVDLCLCLEDDRVVAAERETSAATAHRNVDYEDIWATGYRRGVETAIKRQMIDQSVQTDRFLRSLSGIILRILL